MGRNRFLVSCAAFTLTLSFAAIDARAITLPDTSSPCSTASTDGCLKITNTDSTDYGATAFSAVSDSPFGTAISATGNYYGMTASSANYGITGSAPNVGVEGYATSSTGYGVYGTSVSGGDGVYGQTSGTGKAVHGYNADQTRYAGYFSGNVFSTCSTTAADGCLKISNTQTDPSYPTPAIDAVSSSFGPAVYASGFTGVEAHGAEVGVAAYGPIGMMGKGPGFGVEGIGVGSGYALYGDNPDPSGYAGYFNGLVYATSVSYSPAIYATGFNGLEAHGAEIGVVAYGDVGVVGTGGGYGVEGVGLGSGYGVYGNNPDPSGYAGYFNGKVYSTVSFTTSDARLKKDVAALPYGMNALASLRPVTFKWKDQSRGDGRNIGLLAQELQKVIPELVDEDARSGMLSVNYSGLVPVLVKAVQEQQAIIQRQEARIEGLEQRPLVSSMFSGGVNVLVAFGGLTALLLTVIRRRKSQADQ